MSHWNIIKSQATKFKESNTEWNSFVFKRRYCVKKVDNDFILIEKLSGGKNVKLPRTTAENAIAKLETNKRISQEYFLSSVARKAALVNLHPAIHWDKKSKEFYWKEEFKTTIESVEDFVEEASDDDLQKVQQLVRRRQNQGKFRKKLLSVYDNKCCISNCTIEAVLVAAHIRDHAISGINMSINGLLLRSDLHILFDENLLLIHPDQLIIHLHPSIRTSEYRIYHGNRINIRNDNKTPSKEFLQKKWDEAGWT